MSDESKTQDVARTADAEQPQQGAKAADGDHGGHGDADHADHGLAHTTPVALLVTILGVLLVLTVLTVAVTGIDLGGQGNLIVAMVIATIKAVLVCLFFMHLLWDRKFNLLLFAGSVLFLILFLSMAVTDRAEYQVDIEKFISSQTK